MSDKTEQDWQDGVNDEFINGPSRKQSKMKTDSGEDTQRIEEGWSDERLLIKRIWSRAYLDTEEKHIELLKDYRDKELASLREQLKNQDRTLTGLAASNSEYCKQFRELKGQLAKKEEENRELKGVVKDLIPLAQRHIDLLDGYKGWIEGDPNEEIPDWYAKIPGYKTIIQKAKNLSA